MEFSTKVIIDILESTKCYSDEDSSEYDIKKVQELYKKAANLCETAVKSGDSDAITYLAMFYDDGIVVYCNKKYAI
jgi:TPR repeat protein